jgi:glycogen debranching enzyme
MIWPWLLGAFYDAQLCVYPGSEKQVLASLRPFAEAVRDGCIGSLPEIYEPATMSPAGAISQAWSVAEVLRIYTKVKRSAAEGQKSESARKAELHIREA